MTGFMKTVLKTYGHVFGKSVSIYVVTIFGLKHRLFGNILKKGLRENSFMVSLFIRGSRWFG